MHVHAESRNDGQTISNQGESQWNTLDIDHWKYLWTPWNPLKSQKPVELTPNFCENWKSTGNPFSMNFRENDNQWKIPWNPSLTVLENLSIFVGCMMFSDLTVE